MHKERNPSVIRISEFLGHFWSKYRPANLKENIKISELKERKIHQAALLVILAVHLVPLGQFGSGPWPV